MIDELERLIRFTEKELNLCPWLSTVGIEEIIEATRDELKELEEAIEDKTNVDEEVGDVFRNALILLLKVANEQNVKPSEIIEQTMRKIAKRKPWVNEGKKVSLAKAKEIWEKVKKEERG